MFKLAGKDTSELLEELKKFKSFSRFWEENEKEILPRKALSIYLSEIVEEKGIKKADAIRRSELSEVYAYQIFSGLRLPERKKLLPLLIGMGLSFDEIQNVLKYTGYARLYAKDPFDCAVIYGICKNLSVADINCLLFDYGLDTLG